MSQQNSIFLTVGNVVAQVPVEAGETPDLALLQSVAASIKWPHDHEDPSYQDCGQQLWNIALKYAWKLCPDRGGEVDHKGRPLAPKESVHGHSREDLASMGVLHVLLQAKRGRLDKIPANERWAFIRTMLWNRMLDEYRRFSNRMELQSPTMSDDDNGTTMDSNEALEIVANGRPRAFQRPVVVCSRREVRLLETILDTALTLLPEAMLIKLRFGLCRNDEIGEDEPQFLEAMNFDDLASVGYGHDRFAVKRRVDCALAKLRVLLLADIERRQIGNFTT